MNYLASIKPRRRLITPGPARDALGTIAAVAFAALVAVWPTVDRWTAGGAS